MLSTKQTEKLAEKLLQNKTKERNQLKRRRNVTNNKPVR